MRLGEGGKIHTHSVHSTTVTGPLIKQPTLCSMTAYLAKVYCVVGLVSEPNFQTLHVSTFNYNPNLDGLSERCTWRVPHFIHTADRSSPRDFRHFHHATTIVILVPR